MNCDMSSVLETFHPELLATGFIFTEGPLWNNDGFFYFVDIQTNRQLRWSRNTGTQLVRENTGGGNGTTIDRQGRMIICEGANRRVTRKESHGSWDPIAESYLGNRFNRPNDVVCDSNGNIYFTVADCTGHGVPGAFMSMIGNSLLNEMIIENDID